MKPFSLNFKDGIQFFFCLLFTVMSICCMVGGFFNPVHFLLGLFSVVLVVALYKFW